MLTGPALRRGIGMSSSRIRVLALSGRIWWRIWTAIIPGRRRSCLRRPLRVITTVVGVVRRRILRDEEVPWNLPSAPCGRPKIVGGESDTAGHGSRRTVDQAARKQPRLRRNGQGEEPSRRGIMLPERATGWSSRGRTKSDLRKPAQGRAQIVTVASTAPQGSR